MFFEKSLKIGTHSIFGIYLIFAIHSILEQNLGASQPAEHWSWRKFSPNILF